MRELTLRRIEAIRAVMLTGTISGASDLLNVWAPGISRLVMHAEGSLGLRLFWRRAGLFVPSAEATSVFEQLRRVYRGIENPNETIAALRMGEGARLAFASAPSIALFIAARALQPIRARFPDLFIDLDILKIEETADYLLLQKG